MLKSHSSYDRQPTVAISGSANLCAEGWPEIIERLRARVLPGRFLLAVECYPGVFVRDVVEALAAGLRPEMVLLTEDALHSAEELDARLSPLLTGDPVFGRMNGTSLGDFFDPGRMAAQRDSLARTAGGLVLVAGVGATLLAPDFDLLVYADLTRWEIQRRQRAGTITSLGMANRQQSPAEQYKRGYFVEWRAADRHKESLFDRIDCLLDTNEPEMPRMISGNDYRCAMATVIRRPFSVVPFFDPGPWGGQWMRKRFGLPEGPPNYAWCFNCVPEENSLLLGFGSRRLEIPAINVVLRHPRELLGSAVYRRFGAEFPIRFDLLDTIGGGNLSLQVHPLEDFIRERFGMAYTQDESYYLLDCGEGACVYLGFSDDADPSRFRAELRSAAAGDGVFSPERYLNRWPARKHDHFLIPAGTIHCSGAESMVLEISATPYIFTFKLWDWGRLGLDGTPRPTHVEYGLENIQWDRRAGWVSRELINRVEPLAAGAGWREERTGLHETEFIETRRHWFTGPVDHHTRDTVNVVCLVEGDEIVVESPHGGFDPFVIRYAETFIVPAGVGPYRIRPCGQGEHATIKAWVRTS